MALICLSSAIYCLQAAVALINERYDGLLAEVAAKCKEALKEPKAKLNQLAHENFTASKFLQRLPNY